MREPGYYAYLSEWIVGAQARYNAPDRARSMDYTRYAELRAAGVIPGRDWHNDPSHNTLP